MGFLKSKGLAGIFAGCLALLLIAPVVGADKTSSEYIAEGKEFFKANNFDEAIASFTAALKLDPKSVQALLNRGNAYCRRGYHDKAIADYTEVIRLDPQNGKAYNNRAVAYWFNEEPDKSQADSRKAEELGITVNNLVWQALRGTQGVTPVIPEDVQTTAEKGKLPAAGLKKPESSPGKQP